MSKVYQFWMKMWRWKIIKPCVRSFLPIMFEEKKRQNTYNDVLVFSVEEKKLTLKFSPLIFTPFKQMEDKLAFDKGFF